MTRQRIVIENVEPQLQGGDFFIKRVTGELVHVTADVLGDGHDVVEAEVCYKWEHDKVWKTERLAHSVNDAYSANFVVENQGFYEYKLRGWIDHALNWQHGIEAKLKDAQYVKSELLDGIQYLEAVEPKLDEDGKHYVCIVKDLFADEQRYDEACRYAISEDLHRIFKDNPTRKFAHESATLKIYVDRLKARFSTWYEFFPRSASQEPGKHGTFKDCEVLLSRVASMGFDTLYFPPIHPIGEVNRKGRNNRTNAEEGDSGVPWGIGSHLGGHKAIHPELGSEEDFRNLINHANSLGIEIAMDLAFQAAPDHPYLKEHPSWFKKRPDGTMQYAENPPKKYQDIVNFHWESEDFEDLWKELLSVAFHWVDFGVKVFRVDNPHTKPYYFWNWFIAEIKKKHPDVLFLAEAFSRPKVMQQLAKQGYSQSYTYFTWRTSKHELTEYMTELTQTKQKEYFRPNFWPNTPDINPYHLQGANESQHLIRYALAATLSSNIGLYGPVFEFLVSEPVPGKEEYMNSEKYQICHWDWNRDNKLIRLITKINAIRKQHAALQQTNNIRFCDLHNEGMMAFYKWNQDRTSELLIVISLDPYYKQAGSLRLPYESMNLAPGSELMLKDLVTDNTYTWNDEWNYVELHPAMPFHIFQIFK
ncbi:alpha-1,4-glucan--maltose-1-phosphate maltosyltransferase [Leeuwenhoekiella marinoflava]|uniref:Alpha-1,4-glucan:maltose-1-phosphate maltosyltransferase n=2 Tax=Leeuwenhoekiella marinoflava TaxID=988 RepID=A0A4V1KSF0_9FLAO|nr:alpha-1,4-glucan--maltose-1-phosphate maltosyltransferase [Leeuwenhoekiella marinoflava]RXG30759.1 alpha-1,4-glucan:maltose-1-phosphate maltosyltransferase [Leeuwenhoekiella marinoflava]SHF17432.1 alpha-1,4-glucan:maltose-1-phosphate maltosyltransferase [Leeuwenhoekiella marinoflava DSM 3653]